MLFGLVHGAAETGTPQNITTHKDCLVRSCAILTAHLDDEARRAGGSHHLQRRHWNLTRAAHDPVKIRLEGCARLGAPNICDCPTCTIAFCCETCSSTAVRDIGRGLYNAASLCYNVIDCNTCGNIKVLPSSLPAARLLPVPYPLVSRTESDSSFDPLHLAPSHEATRRADLALASEVARWAYRKRYMRRP